MKVSIVTISFNQGRFLERAIRSVLEQDYPGLEYIVVDPGSTDDSRAVIGRYEERIARTIYEPDDGPADGLNTGFAAATGEIFGFLNADDMLLPSAVRQAVQAFQDRPEADVVYGHGFLIDEHDQMIRRFYSDRFSLWRFVHDGVSILQQSTFFRREAFAAVGGFNPRNRVRWDRELWLDMALAGRRFVLVPAFWSCFRIHRAGITGSARLGALYHEEGRRLFRKATGRLPRRSDVLLVALARILKWSFNPVGFCFRLGDLTRAQARRSPI